MGELSGPTVLSHGTNSRLTQDPEPGDISAIYQLCEFKQSIKRLSSFLTGEMIIQIPTSLDRCENTMRYKCINSLSNSENGIIFIEVKERNDALG